MSRCLGAFHSNEAFIRAVAPFPGGLLRAHAKSLPEFAFTFHDHLKRSEHRLRIPELELHPARLLLRDDAFFITLHGEGNGCASGDRIYAILVTNLIRHRNCTDIIDATVRSKCSKRFV